MSHQDPPSDTAYFQKNLKAMVSIKDWGMSDKMSSFREGELLPHFCYNFEDEDEFKILVETISLNY